MASQHLGQMGMLMFRTPALCGRAGLDAGLAFESLVRRKPRGGGGAVWLVGTYGWDERGGCGDKSRCSTAFAGLVKAEHVDDDVREETG